MLVLTRYVNQSIDIGDNVKVTILGFDGSGRIKLGIQAPRDVTIIRSEIVGTDRDRPRQLNPPPSTTGIGWGPQS